MIPTRSHSEKGKTLKLVKRSEVAMCWEEGGMYRQSTQHFEGSETTLHDTIMMETCAHVAGVEEGRAGAAGLLGRGRNVKDVLKHAREGTSG